MKTALLFFLLLLFAHTDGIAGPLERGSPDTDYLPGRLIVKIHPEAVFFQNSETSAAHPAPTQPIPGRLLSFFEHHELVSAYPVFGPDALSKLQKMGKSHGPISEKKHELTQSLQHTFSISYRSGQDPLDLAHELEKLPWVKYAEPHYVYKTADYRQQPHPTDPFIPNDPLIGTMNHNYFDYMGIFRAWGIQTGSRDVVIAIIDTGVYYDHPDLRDNLWHNPQPGLANEFMPEFDIRNDTIGWNFWEAGDIYKGEDPVQNANPTGNYSTHGTRVAGIAAAVTNNGEGMAGTGFNTRFMPVKVGGTKLYPGSIAFAYHAILYAAINGADVISCSFHGSGKSKFGEDVIAFALEAGALVVAAIGNNGVSTSGTYPALLDDVLSVGAVSNQFDDKLTSFSNFGYKLDVFAVGQRMISTSFQYDEHEISWTPDYSTSSGTSLSTPVVSGLAALIRAEYPDWPPQQIASQIRSTARSLYEANPDPKYANKLGSGVIDAWHALTGEVPVIRFTGYHFKKNNNQKINVGETGTLTVEGVHFGSTSPKIRFMLEPLQSRTPLASPFATLESLEPGEVFTVDFTVTISNDFRLDSVPRFRLFYTMDDSGFETSGPSYVIEYDRLLFGIHNNNRLSLSIPSDGTIGFMNPEDKSIGTGLIPVLYDNVLGEAGFMISGIRDGKQVMANQVRDSTSITRHFLPMINSRVVQHPEIRNALLGHAAFTSANHPEANDLVIELETITLNSFDVDQVAFLKYHIKNPGNHTWKNVHFGLFNHWDIREAGQYQSHFDEERNLLFVKHQGGPPYVGTASIGSLSSALAIDNKSEMALWDASNRTDSLNFGIAYDRESNQLDGFTDTEKHLALRAGTHFAEKNAEDLSTVIAKGPYTLYPGSEVTIGFIYGWGVSSNQLIGQISAALEINFLDSIDSPGDYSRTGRVSDELTLHPNFPNPFSNRTNIRFDLQHSGHVQLSVYNLLGMHVATLVNDVRDIGPHFFEFDGTGIASGLYIVVLRADGKTKSHTMKLVR